MTSGHGRSLPGAAFGRRLDVSGSQRSREPNAPSRQPQADVTIAAAPPRILQRPKGAAPGMRSDGTSANKTSADSQERKTVEQRQEDYRLARERIFGSVAPSSSSKHNSPST